MICNRGRNRVPLKDCQAMFALLGAPVSQPDTSTLAELAGQMKDVFKEHPRLLRLYCRLAGEDQAFQYLLLRARDEKTSKENAWSIYALLDVITPGWSTT